MEKKVREINFEQGVLPQYRRLDYVFQRIIQIQAAAAANNLRPRKFYRFLDENGGTFINPVRMQSSILKRQYADPVNIHLFIEVGSLEKPKQRTLVEEQISHTVRIDIAEGIRLGQVFQIKDADEDFPYYFYLPKAGDIYEWDDRLFEIDDMKPERYYTPLERFVRWEGSAKLFRTDSSDPNRPLNSSRELPRVSRHNEWTTDGQSNSV